MTHSPRRASSAGTLLAAIALVAVIAVASAIPREAAAIPAFARRHETTCATCHQGHYPRLNAYGKLFRENGYQLPDGAEEPARAARSVTPDDRLALFREVPLSLRVQTFGAFSVSPEATGEPVYKNSVYSFLAGGGSVANDVSFYFAWTPWPTSDLHHARLGLHNLLEDRLGRGTLNVRAGSMFLLDLQRPSHRYLSPGASHADEVTVGNNGFNLAEPQLGVEVYGRPSWGPLRYELALVQGDAPGGAEQDGWKDLFARVSYTLFQHTDHEVTPGLFGYVGRSEFVTELGDATLAQRDDFWIAGADAEADLGPLNLSGMAFYSRHSDPANDGLPVAYSALRAEVLLLAHDRWVPSVRFERVGSQDDPSLALMDLAAHVTYLIRPNVLATLTWRQDLLDFGASDAVLSLEATF